LRKVGVVSGKGGTGKSTCAYSLARGLADRGFSVGLVDMDLSGPNVEDILGGEVGVDWDRDLLIPAESGGLKFISMGHIAGRGNPILWRGSDCASAARQLVERVDWGRLDFLVLDFPPALPDEAKEALRLIGYALIVTVPSLLSRSKVGGVVEACGEYRVPILGVVVNMAWFRCPGCGGRYRVFPEGHSFEDLGIPTIAEIPLDPEVARSKIIRNFPVEEVLEAMERPVILEERRGGLRSRLLRLLLRWL